MRALYLLLLAACGSGNGNGGDDVVDAAPPDVLTDGRLHVDDGTPTRLPCTSSFGQKLPASGTYGRLDGYLVAIVLPSGMNSCNADTSHVHLQVRMQGATYDIAVDATDGTTNMDDVNIGGIDHDLPTMPWTEGFHTGVNEDYVSLGVHSTDMVFKSKQQVVDTLTADLATANHISIYTITYGGDGAHLVHRNGNGRDGMIITEPLSQPAHFRLLSFTGQAF